MPTQPQPQDTVPYAIVEIFGHTRIAGRISEYTLGGCSFVRIDVPEIPRGDGQPPATGFTRLYGQGAIYSVTFVDEETARVAARHFSVQPVDVWAVEQAIRAMAPERVRRLIDEVGDTPDNHHAHYELEFEED